MSEKAVTVMLFVVLFLIFVFFVVCTEQEGSR